MRSIQREMMVEHDFQALAARVTQLEDLVLLHTERLTQLIGYQKHIVGLLEWKETFQQPHPQDLEQPPKPVKSTVNPEPLKKTNLVSSNEFMELSQTRST